LKEFICAILKKSIFHITIFILLISFSGTQAQETNSDFTASEAALKGLFNSLFARDSVRYLKTDDEKLKLNDSILHIFKNTLDIDRSIEYPFDSLKHVGKLPSADKKIRLITWNLRFKDGTFKYYGFVQYNNVKKDKVITFPLIDKSDSIVNPTDVVLSYYNWFGALYYQVHEYTDKGKTFYVLFGWDGNNYYTNKKIIEILSFNKNGKPVFGKSVFKTENKLKKRVIFEHALKTSMTCKFNESVDAIVFDHLSPLKKSQTGDYQFYGPDGSYDGFRLEKGKWVYVPNIYVTNPKVKKKNK
jgi:hypothetical protein